MTSQQKRRLGSKIDSLRHYSVTNLAEQAQKESHLLEAIDTTQTMFYEMQALIPELKNEYRDLEKEYTLLKESGRLAGQRPGQELQSLHDLLIEQKVPLKDPEPSEIDYMYERLQSFYTQTKENYSRAKEIGMRLSLEKSDDKKKRLLRLMNELQERNEISRHKIDTGPYVVASGTFIKLFQTFNYLTWSGDRLKNAKSEIEDTKYSYQIDEHILEGMETNLQDMSEVNTELKKEFLEKLKTISIPNTDKDISDFCAQSILRLLQQVDQEGQLSTAEDSQLANQLKIFSKKTTYAKSAYERNKEWSHQQEWIEEISSYHRRNAAGALSGNEQHQLIRAMILLIEIGAENQFREIFLKN